ncbi:Der GTPase-activating protein YihI [Shewanella intestini]|uniref:Der GTPase-activating protein YihI n=1 Tax=Shewanella intestini TaxID=2017544 RepID=A0ABS5I3Y3_9GAMM|nr:MULTISPECIES: Der GTPase-activating protein YihI [Shewanella]MBR9728616.1 Der GTPase-activating protein YihI [Shewanella intestini]MRG37328.1 Der GTPase-activating protein YihI [Shewanella sp. XMDDZSB0408]
MARSKKTRKGGENGPKHAPRVKKADRNQVDSKKKDTGHKSGSRHNETLLNSQSPQAKGAKRKDPRHGSKKPVSLVAPKAITEPLKAKVKQPKLTDEQKLLKLEDDPRLNKLLDMLEEGHELNANDQKWLDEQLDTIERLMKNLGLEDGEMPAEAPAKAASDDELLNRFESGADLLNMYQNKD